jgi:WD40 repeat protein
MAYSPPHLITAHPNNTMKQYFVRINDNTLDISFKRTLYGHTFKVDALAIDASRRKLVSGDRSGIKIWDLSKKGECQVTLNNHNNQSSMDELPDFNIKTLGFDEDKIFAVVNSIEKSFVRLWSFNSLK